MRLANFSTLALPALALAATGSEQAPVDPQSLMTAAAETAASTPIPTPTQPVPGEVWQNKQQQQQQEKQEGEGEALELREVGAALAATVATTAAADVTSYYLAASWISAASSEQWEQFIYTQTFASFPGQLTTAGAGSIGLGTLTGTVGVVKDEKSGATPSVMPQGSLWTAALALTGVAIGMGAVLLH